MNAATQGRRVLCECGNKATLRHRGAWKCDRCHKIESTILREIEEPKEARCLNRTIHEPQTHPDLSDLGGKKYRRVYMRKIRQMNYDNGLTARGNLPNYQRHPELNGLRGLEYMKAYRDKRRREKWQERNAAVAQRILHAVGRDTDSRLLVAIVEILDDVRRKGG